MYSGAGGVMMNQEGGSKMLTSLILAAVGGLVVGGGVVYKVTKKEPVEQTPPPVVVVPDPNDSEVLKQVTSPDLVSVSCSKEHIDQHGDLLCREMFCRLQSRGIDSKTSGSECEQIANIANTIQILDACSIELETNEEDRTVTFFNEDCSQLFQIRK